MSNCVAMYSGGVCSFLAAKEAVGRYGKDNVTLLFSDTQIEDEDLYRFLREGATLLGCKLVELRSINLFDLARKHNTVPSNMMPFCSQELKVEPAQEWIRNNAPAATLVFGITWWEAHRIPKVEKRWSGYDCWFPLAELGALKGDPLKLCRDAGIEPPRLYEMGFAHNNCGGTCVRGGHGAWRHANDHFPERVAKWVALEDEISAIHGRPCTILKDRRNNETKPLPLRALLNLDDYDRFDIGGCGCFVDDATKEAANE